METQQPRFFSDLLLFLAGLDAQPAPPSWYYPLTADAWTLPRTFPLHRGEAFDAQATEAAIRQTTLRLLKQSYAKELAEAGSETALQEQKATYRRERQERRSAFFESLLSNSPTKIILKERTAEEDSAFAALASPPEWFITSSIMSDIRCLWDPATANESWEDMDTRITEMEQRSRKRDFYCQLQKAGGLEQLREINLGQLQQNLGGNLWRFCHQNG